MVSKVLFCATVDYHFEKFHIPYIKWFKEQGWEVHVAASGELALPYVDRKFNIPIQRSPFRMKNFEAYGELKTIIDTNKYNIIHCHTPMGGVITRLAARQARKQGTHVLYTAHGFHFCKGAPLLNWMVYYPIEKWLSRYTDCLITINEEDYKLATAHRFQAKQIERVHGVGVDTERYHPVSDIRKHQMRAKFGYTDDEYLLFYAAEFNKNKNQQLLIRALANAREEMPNAKLLLAGDGALLEVCKELSVQLGIQHMVQFLGYRNDIDELLPICDIAVASSAREGLPVNIVEAMACGLPVVASKNRGHVELVLNEVNGYILEAENPILFSEKILSLYRSKELQEYMRRASLEKVKQFSLDEVSLELKSIYLGFLMGEQDEAKSQYHRAYI